MRVFEFPVINSASSQRSCVALWYIGKDGTVGLLSSPVFSKAHRVKSVEESKGFTMRFLY